MYDPKDVGAVIRALRQHAPQPGRGVQLAGDVVPLAGAVASGDNWMHAGPAAANPIDMLARLRGANTSNVSAMPPQVWESYLARSRGLQGPPTVLPPILMPPNDHGQGGNLPPKM
jgi:hypothetical protein